MRLYHFTASHLSDGIIRKGLTLGCIAVSIDPPAIRRGFQWLTSSSDWAQEWCSDQILLPYRRDDVRFTVEVPEGCNRLLKWTERGRSLTLGYDDLSSFGDPENWYLVRGVVPSAWIVGYETNPRLRLARALGVPA